MRHGRNVQARVESGDHSAGRRIVGAGEVLGAQPFQQQGAAVRIGAQQADRTVSRPAAQCEVFVFGLVVGEADLQHGRRTVGGADR